MINILVTGVNGPEDLGLTILLEAIHKAHPTATPTTILPRTPAPRLAFGTRTAFMTEEVEQTGDKTFLISSTPVDTIHRALLDRARFSTRPWDTVLIGVQPEAHTGLDVLLSAACAMGMTAATAYLLHATIFNQETAEGADRQSRLTYAQAEKIIPHYLKATKIEKGTCWNVNLPRPATTPRGYKETKTAHYHPSRLPPTDLVPRARDEQSDVTALAEGYTTITHLDLRLNAKMYY